MAFTPICSRCGKDLTEPGGILLSPPLRNPSFGKVGGDNMDLVVKQHLGVECGCYAVVDRLINE
jgi:hypothetical protein